MDSDSRRTPVRVAFVTRRTSPHVKATDDPTVMTYPEGILRAVVAVQALAIALVVVSLIWDAPLEELADPMHTPNPAKAPWYFLGLQELLHYFPPVVAGVIIPGLVVVALIVIPYFNINIEAEGIWLKNRGKRLQIFGAVVSIFSAVMLLFHVYAVLIPTLLIAALMVLAAQSAPDSPSRFRRWLVSKPVSYWVMTWFLVQAAVLTIIGTHFRGPGWSWVWPWRS
jgi:hypothetical protein